MNCLYERWDRLVPNPALPHHVDHYVDYRRNCLVNMHASSHFGYDSRILRENALASAFGRETRINNPAHVLRAALVTITQRYFTINNALYRHNPIDYCVYIYP